MLDYSQLHLPQKKLQILKTGLDLFQQFGIKRITIQEICQTAGVSKMTFYKYFRNKNELVRFLWAKGFEQAMVKFDAICEMEISFEKKLQLMLKLKEESTVKISHQFALDYFYASPDLKDFFDKLAQDNITRFLDFLKTAQKRGEVRLDLKPKFLLAVIDNIKLLVKDEALIKSYPSYHDFIMEVNNFLFYGILPRTDTEKR